jgi:uncharacterized protein (TIGR03437 family)
MEYAPGDSLARITAAPRLPAVSATPSSAPAGSVVRLSLGGFDANAQVRVSVTGQADFLTTVPSGAYIWESYIPATAASSTITVKAVDVNSQASSQANYTIRGGSAARVALSTVRGDLQTGIPGAILPVKIQVLLADDSGNPIPNAPVRFTPSPGGEISDASAVTDANGLASASWRLPTDEGVALLSVSANAHLVNVSARAAHSGLTNVPVMSQSGISTPLGSGTDPIGTKGALLVSAASAIRYFQNRGDLPSPNGLADAPTLNGFLKALPDGFLQDQIVNLWRLGGFVGNTLDVRTTTPSDKVIRDAIALGSPVILALTLTTNGVASGSHFVVATGVDAGGNLTLMDPLYGQTSFSSYLYGFQAAAGTTITATITGAAVFTAQAPSSTGFLVAATALPVIQSPVRPCGEAFTFPFSNGTFSLSYCPAATESVFELDFTALSDFSGTFIDLSGVVPPSGFSGSGTASYAADRTSGQWMFAPLSVQFPASGVVNSANAAAGLAPGALASILGLGLSNQPAVTVNGQSATVLKSTPFRLDFQIPSGVAAGPAVINVSSDSLGSAEQTITLLPVAPSIQSAANPNGASNGRYQPVLRGQSLTVFGTGFGALAPPRGLVVPVHALIGGVEVTVISVTQPANSPGLYQLTLAIPSSLAPGLSLELVLQQGDATSNTALIAVQ